ncbi:MAG: hypothetical protein ACTHKQ_11865 [Mesorhizobium sp.]
MSDFTIDSFATMLLEAAAVMPMAEKAALKAAGEIVQAEAKAEIGTYQDAAGPFAAWAPLAEATKTDRAKQGFTPDDPLLRTGEMRDSIGLVVEGHEAHVGSNDDKAVWQELGTTKGIPPRSFLGGAAVRKSAEVRDVIGREIVGALVGEETLIALP